MNENIRLEAIDWAVIGSYFAVLLGIGLYYRRFAGRSLDDYFMAGRRNSGWTNGLSYAAALMNADVAPAYSGLAVASGLFVCWFYLSRFGVALFLGSILFAVFWRRLNLFTVPEFYELRFGGTASSVIRAWVAIKSSLVAMVAWTGTGLLAMHKIAGPVLGFGKTTTMLVVLPIVLAYVVLSGFGGVVITSSVQTLIMVIGSAMLCGIVLHDVGGPAALAERLQSAVNTQMLHTLPPVDDGVLPAAAALAILLGTSIGYGGDAAPLGGAMEGQYVLSSRNAREASKMYLVAEVSLFMLLLLVTLPSLAAAVEWPALRLPLTDPNHIDREQAYGLLMAKYLPPGMLGLLFVTMLASVMSTIGSNLTFGAQVLVNDVYRRYLQAGRSERHYLWMGRLATLLIVALALVVAYRVELILNVAVFMVAASAAELPANWAQWWWWRFNQWGRLSASFGGLILAVLVWFVLPSRDWEWWNRTYLVIAMNTALWLTVTLLTPPDPDRVLARFHRAARPLGAWGPVRRREAGSSNAATMNEDEAESASWTLIFTGVLVALVGAGSVMLMTTGLSCLYVARYGTGSMLLAGFVVTAGIFLKSYGPYLARLEAWAPARSAASETSLTTSAGTAVPQAQSSDSQPLPANVMVALATAAYGLVIIFGGLVWVRGKDLTLNLLAGVSLLLAAVLTWLLGRTRERTG